ncbi:ribonuclease J [Desulfoluna butyratoxydans]|uniref:Ribonuclease J n=1 Tax=Desulfoluna butyratoxydans TaxID=231438 RepID=A0A4U8YP77_9BACT|nr:ribonuclease J [Desulfoluna butyratoxydans]VFQ46015.1 ribonuclease j [Desulfoluna butyratoxydans]
MEQNVSPEGDKALRIIPLGGLGEIGLNMMVIEYGDDAIIIDAGLMFPEDYMLGIDIVIPSMDYIKQNASSILAVILTHAHEDHIGALPYLLKEVDIPVYGTSFTLGVVRRKLEEQAGLGSSSLNVFHAGELLRIGPFEVDPIRVSHSTVDGVGLAVRTPRGVIVHTGDFKINLSGNESTMTDVNSFARYGEKGVLALLSDSTNVEKHGYTISDGEVADSLRRIAFDAEGRIVVALFASNVARIQQIVDIAEKKGCKVVFCGRSVELTVKIARELGYLHIPQGMELDIRRSNDFPANRLILITTGSQGEPMSALARMAAGNHKHIKIRKDDTIVFSSKIIPGNEKAIAGIINTIYRLGANVVYEKTAPVHVSGHAHQEELKTMMHLTRPRYFIPIHGEYRHLVHHARLAESAGIPEENVVLAENGDIITFDEDGARLDGKVATGRVLVDGKGVGDVGRSVLKERQMLAEDGLVVVTIVFDEETGVIVYGPEIVSRGFVFWTATGHLLDDAQCVILEVVEEVGMDAPNRTDLIRSKIQKALRQYFNFTIKRRPIIVPVIMEL